MSYRKINRVSANVVLGLSLFAMLLVGGATALAILGKFTPPSDEGAAAHLFQLAIVLLLPAGLAYLATADWRRPLEVSMRLAVPSAALVIAFSTLYYLEHMQ
jgi:hypothetical protein